MIETLNARETLLTIDALKIRAPSMWSFKPCFLAISPTLSVYSTVRHLPPQLHLEIHTTYISYKAFQT